REEVGGRAGSRKRGSRRAGVRARGEGERKEDQSSRWRPPVQGEMVHHSDGCLRWMSVFTWYACATDRILSSSYRLPMIVAQIGCALRPSGGCAGCGAPPLPPPCAGTSNLYCTTTHGCPVCELAPTSADGPPMN